MSNLHPIFRDALAPFRPAPPPSTDELMDMTAELFADDPGYRSGYDYAAGMDHLWVAIPADGLGDIAAMLFMQYAVDNNRNALGIAVYVREYARRHELKEAVNK